MKINKLMNKYQDLKKRGVLQVKKNNLNKVVLVAKKFDQYTGEIIGTKMYRVDKKDVSSQIKDLRSKIQNLKELEKDLS